TTISYPELTSHRSMSAEQRAELGVGAGTVRVSVGIEDPDDVIADFAHALSAYRICRLYRSAAVRGRCGDDHPAPRRSVEFTAGCAARWRLSHRQGDPEHPLARRRLGVPTVSDRLLRRLCHRPGRPDRQTLHGLTLSTICLNAYGWSNGNHAARRQHAAPAGARFRARVPECRGLRQGRMVQPRWFR